jgi:hypothetical protein
MSLRERTRPGLGMLVLLLTVWLGAENFSALAQNSDATPANHESTQEAQTAEQLAEAQGLLKGPAGNPECVWLGRRAVSLLWRDDMDTAVDGPWRREAAGRPLADVRKYRGGVRCFSLVMLLGERHGELSNPDSHHARGDSRTLGPLCRALFSVQTYCSASALDRCDKRRSVTAFGHIIVQ